MTTAIRIEALPARLGDCLIVECAREKGRPWRMLVDGGPPDTWPVLEARLQGLDPDDRHIDVAVVTHVDSDHIGGMIAFLESEHAEHVGDFWFNGRAHLPGAGRRRSIAQGESLSAALSGRDSGRRTAWNEAFAGGPIDTGPEAGFLEVPVSGGPQITVVSPTTERLAALGERWREAMESARRGAKRVREPDAPGPLGDLEQLAEEDSDPDSSTPNGSSIALLVEHRGASLLLGADAFADVLTAGLRGVAAARGLDALPVDAFKLPHHGSMGNVTRAMIDAAPAGHYLVCSNGDIFHHPDDTALARVVLNAPQGATLAFNYRNPRTQRWDDPRLRKRHGYSTRFPRAPAAGVVIELPAR